MNGGSVRKRMLILAILLFSTTCVLVSGCGNPARFVGTWKDLKPKPKMPSLNDLNTPSGLPDSSRDSQVYLNGTGKLVINNDETFNLDLTTGWDTGPGSNYRNSGTNTNHQYGQYEIHGNEITLTNTNKDWSLVLTLDQKGKNPKLSTSDMTLYKVPGGPFPPNAGHVNPIGIVLVFGGIIIFLLAVGVIAVWQSRRGEKETKSDEFDAKGSIDAEDVDESAKS